MKTKLVFGGHFASRQSWYFGEQKLEVVGKYKYLGLNFSTLPSFNIGTEDFVSRERKEKKYTKNLKSAKNQRMSLMLSVLSAV